MLEYIAFAIGLLPFGLIFLYIVQKLYSQIHYETRYRISKFRSSLTYPFRAFFHSVGQFFYWGWKLRNNRNWDQYYFYVILNLKLKAMYAGLKDGWCEEKTLAKMLKKLQMAINLCEKQLHDNYFEYTNKVEEVWGESHIEFHPTENKSLSRMYRWNANAMNPEEQKIADREHRKAALKDWRQQERDKKKLFKIIAENINTWWD